ncbi:hypothetical protein AGMMS49975_20040 [Clostridia bacterium]|nr:hypothetical protein AGMMS49975_20040 [Clostridia bacterium]
MTLSKDELRNQLSCNNCLCFICCKRECKADSDGGIICNDGGIICNDDKIICLKRNCAFNEDRCLFAKATHEHHAEIESRKSMENEKSQTQLKLRLTYGVI